MASGHWQSLLLGPRRPNQICRIDRATDNCVSDLYVTLICGMFNAVNITNTMIELFLGKYKRFLDNSNLYIKSVYRSLTALENSLSDKSSLSHCS